MSSFADRQVIAAHFINPEAASEAIRKLREAGFNPDQIGTSFEGAGIEGRTFETGSYGADYETHHRSFMDKMKQMFTGEDDYQERNDADSEASWRVPDRYEGRLTGGANIVTVHGTDRLDEAARILEGCGGSIDREFVASEYEGNRDAELPDQNRRIRLLSEVLRVNKKRVNTGEVRLRKEVRTENQTLEVPVTHEELVIERVPTNERSASGAEIGRDEEIRVPLAEERVDVEKTPVVREEVRVGKREVAENQTVSDNVRHEELNVDDKTGRVRGDVKGKNKKIA